MAEGTSRRSATLWFGAGALVALGLLGTAIALAQRLPQGPVAIAFDREACHHCHMQIGEPAFASQAQLADGQVLDFDDPGCLLDWLAHSRAPLRTLWFHHAREDRWVRGNAVGFVEVGQTPMGWGLGAVDAAQPGALTLAQATAEVENLERTRTEVGHAR